MSPAEERDIAWAGLRDLVYNGRQTIYQYTCYRGDQGGTLKVIVLHSDGPVFTTMFFEHPGRLVNWMVCHSMQDVVYWLHEECNVFIDASWVTEQDW